jgi:TPR repeat protein
MTYVENRDTRETLIQYQGEEAYQRFDDSTFKLHYLALWNIPVYNNIGASLYGMHQQYIDWDKARQMVANADQHDPIVIAFKSMLLHPTIFPSNRLQKDQDDSRREWDRAEHRGLTVLAEAGNPWAQWIKGMHLEIVECDLESAKKLYIQAADQGHAFAQCSLGFLYQEDDQFDIAESYYEQAAFQGHALAQFNLSMLINEEDFAKMKPYLEQAADQGQAEALYYLGTLHVDSDIVPQDYGKAKWYFERALYQGHTDAQVDLDFVLMRLNSQKADTRARRHYKEFGLAPSKQA